MSNYRWSIGVAAVALLFTAADVDAQRRTQRPVGYVGLAIVGADPVGELSHLIDAGVGGQLTAAAAMDPWGRVRMRADVGVMVYGQERRTVCFSLPVGCRVALDLTTTNLVFFGGVGPEVVLATGPVEPYLNGSVGFSYFATTSSLSGSSDLDEFASTTNFSDAVFAWRAGGGVRLRLKGGATPVALDLGVERHQNGEAEFLTEGDIVDHPDGSITLYPNRSDANYMTFRVGVTVGIPRGRDRVR